MSWSRVVGLSQGSAESNMVRERERERERENEREREREKENEREKERKEAVFPTHAIISKFRPA